MLIYEELHSGALKLSDQVSASAEAAGMGGSQIYLKEGETMSVEDLLKSICIASANDAMVAMAEQISGTQEAFVERMNEKAQELKLSNTHFTNASGLHDPQHYSCASDMARIASALLQEGGEELLAITGTYDCVYPRGQRAEVLAGQYQQAHPADARGRRLEDRLYRSGRLLHYGDGMPQFAAR